jgi:hypothetical protein
MGTLIDLTGQTFGRLTVRERAGVAREKKAAWLCDCACGGTRIVCSRELRGGDTASCGCLRREVFGGLNRTHGRAGTREYRSWQAAKDRCYNPRNDRYLIYGARGITMDSAWCDDFARFFAYMGECPPGCTIDRINPDGPYAPGNCRWATAPEQGNNKRRTVYVLVRGERMTARAAADRFGFAYNTVRQCRDQEVGHFPKASPPRKRRRA